MNNAKIDDVGEFIQSHSKILAFGGKTKTAFQASTEIAVLDLSERKINTIPEEIGLLIGLKVLKLNNNNINALPAEIRKLANLRRFELTGNNFTVFPLEIVHLPKLEVLDFVSNSITILPAGINLYNVVYN